MPAPRAVLYDVHHNGLKIHVPHTKISASGMLKTGTVEPQVDEIVATVVVTPPPPAQHVVIDVPQIEPAPEPTPEPVVETPIVQEALPAADEPTAEPALDVTNDESDKKVTKKKFGRK